MKNLRKLILTFLTVILGASLLFSGCTTSKKPYQSTTPTPMNKTTTQSPTYSKSMNNRVMAEAQKETGVRKATVVTSGKHIYVALDLNSNLGTKTAASVETAVLNRIKKMKPGYTVSVTSDADTVTRIKKVSQGIAQGKPLTSFKTELDNIGSRLKPRTK